MIRSLRSCQYVGATLLLLAASWPQAAEALQIFHPFRNFTVNGAGAAATFIVPANTTFVVESVSGRIAIPTGKQITNCQLSTPADNTPPAKEAVVLYMEPKLLARNLFDGSQNFNQDVYTFNTATRAYVADTVFFSIATDSFELPTAVSFAAHGYLIPTLTADFNLNGVVDTADYTLWRDLRTVPLTAGTYDVDANSDGHVDGLDLAVWQASFSQLTTANASAATVPEPCTLLLLAGCAGGWFALRRRTPSTRRRRMRRRNFDRITGSAGLTGWDGIVVGLAIAWLCSC